MIPYIIISKYKASNIPKNIPDKDSIAVINIHTYKLQTNLCSCLKERIVCDSNFY